MQNFKKSKKISDPETPSEVESPLPIKKGPSLAERLRQII